MFNNKMLLLAFLTVFTLGIQSSFGQICNAPAGGITNNSPLIDACARHFQFHMNKVVLSKTQFKGQYTYGAILYYGNTVNLSEPEITEIPYSNDLVRGRHGYDIDVGTKACVLILHPNMLSKLKAMWRRGANQQGLSYNGQLVDPYIDIRSLHESMLPYTFAPSQKARILWKANPFEGKFARRKIIQMTINREDPVEHKQESVMNVYCDDGPNGKTMSIGDFINVMTKNRAPINQDARDGHIDQYFSIETTRGDLGWGWDQDVTSI